MIIKFHPYKVGYDVKFFFEKLIINEYKRIAFIPAALHSNILFLNMLLLLHQIFVPKKFFFKKGMLSKTLKCNSPSQS